MIVFKKYRKCFFVFLFGFLFTVGSVIMPTAQAKSTISLNYKKATILTGETLKLSLSFNSDKVKWSSSDKTVAKVSQTGKVTAKKVGFAKITAKVNNKKYTCKIKVEKPKVYGKSFILAPPTKFLLNIANTTLPIEWKSKDTTIAKVSSKGVVTAVSTGVTTITAKVSKKTFKFKISVASSISYTDGRIFVDE